MTAPMLSWGQIARLGVVQMCLGAVVVLTTSTLNRLMTVELALPAVLPGALVALHYGIQISRPAWGFRSDTRGNRTRFIIGGMAVLALGGFLAALAVALMGGAFWPGMALSILAYALIGVGVGASGTSLLALVATATAPRRRATSPASGARPACFVSSCPVRDRCFTRASMSRIACLGSRCP